MNKKQPARNIDRPPPPPIEVRPPVPQRPSPSSENGDRDWLSTYMPIVFAVCVCCLALWLLLLSLSRPETRDGIHASSGMGATSGGESGDSVEPGRSGSEGDANDGSSPSDDMGMEDEGDSSEYATDASSLVEAMSNEQTAGESSGNGEHQNEADGDEVEFEREGRLATFQLPNESSVSLPWSESSGGARSDFFGAQATGKRFVYIVDASGSMAGRPFIDACEELMRSIDALESSQSYFVMFFNHDTLEASNRKFWKATRKNNRAIRDWVDTMAPRGGTEPLDALTIAIELKPDAIYFLTDGEFHHRIVDQVCDANVSKIPIHSIALGPGAAVAPLEEMAQRSGGSCQRVGQ